MYIYLDIGIRVRTLGLWLASPAKYYIYSAPYLLFYLCTSPVWCNMKCKSRNINVKINTGIPIYDIQPQWMILLLLSSTTQYQPSLKICIPSRQAVFEGGQGNCLCEFVYFPRASETTIRMFYDVFVPYYDRSMEMRQFSHNLSLTRKMENFICRLLPVRDWGPCCFPNK